MIANQRFLGIDGGGSKTEALLVDEQGRVMGRGLDGPCNPNFVRIEAARQALQQAVLLACPDTPLEKIARIVINAPGLGQHANQTEIARWLAISPGCLSVSGDVQNVSAAALANQPGVAVLAGTGSFAVGRNASGKMVSVGGWGPALGDEGSGYAVGLAALKAVIYSFEGRLPETQMKAAILQHFRLDDVFQLRSHFYRLPNIQQQVSALAPLVAAAAERGDAAAADIYRQAGEDLADLAAVIIYRLELDQPDHILVLTGGLRRAGHWILEPFEASIRRQFSQIQIRPPRLTPAAGSALLAMEAAGIKINPQILVNLEQGFESF